MNSEANRNQPTHPGDGVAQRDGPAVLQQDQQAGGVGRDLGEDVPALLLVEHPAAFGDGLGAALGPDLEALLAGRTQPDEPAHQGAEGLLLVGAELAVVQHLDLAVGALVHAQGVDHPDQVVVAEPVQLLSDLALEVGVLEPQHQQLHRSNRHGGLSPGAQ
jgi:hypothetical protein